MDTTGNHGLNPSPGSGSSKSDVCSVRKADANTMPGDLEIHDSEKNSSSGAYDAADADDLVESSVGEVTQPYHGVYPSPGSASSKSDVCSVRKADANTVPGDSDTSVVLKIPAQKTHDLTGKLGYDGVHEAVDYAGGKSFIVLTQFSAYIYS